MTSLEKTVAKLLSRLGFTVKSHNEMTDIDKLNTIYSQYKFSKNIRIDFALPSSKIAIETNGDYWHGSFENELNAIQAANIVRDSQREKTLAKHGWRIIYIKEKMTDNLDKLKLFLSESIVSTMEL